MQFKHQLDNGNIDLVIIAMVCVNCDLVFLFWSHGRDKKGFSSHGGDQKIIMDMDIESLKSKGGWIEDDECAARLIYANGRFVPSLSIVLCNFISGNMIPECTVLRLNCINV